ncbi:hypothetical protein ABCS02_23870 [Microbacterium sp. X-17]|uniref:COG4705 family protein n=1 Tax=Microbacterium sp. X-17 TaxID=3144404 RepID=UPI0031F4984F
MPETRRGTSSTALDAARAMTDKVPQITVLFWVVKVLTTGMGETASDFLVTTIEPVVAVAVALLALIAILVVQFRMRRYVPWVYWSAAAMVSVFGTMAADVVHVQFGVPYAVSTVVFAVALAAVFTLWWSVERTLSIHSIRTTRREAFYWAAVLLTFALGTATGDWLASSLGLGYFVAGLVFLVLIAIPAIGYFFFRMNAIVAFWIAYVLTRPLGASFADWLGVGPARGGIGLGTGVITAILLAAFIVCVTYLSLQNRPTQQPVDAA